MKKFKNVKKIINSKLLYAFPLVGAGLFFTQQSAHAMFNPPNKQPPVKHFVPITSSSTSTPTQTTTTAPRPWRSQLNTTPSSGRPLTSTTSSSWRSTSNSSTSYASKTSTTNASSKKEESTLRTTARNFSDFIKDSTKNALEEELSRELNFMLSENRGSSGETIDQTVANTWRVVFETSRDIFQSEMKKELSLRNISLNKKGEQDLIKASEDFGKYMGNTAATQLKRAALGFSEVAVTENNIPEVILKIQKVSESLGDNMSSHIFREFLTSAFDFMVNHSSSNDF